jgi:hypothetical protein
VWTDERPWRWTVSRAARAPESRCFSLSLTGPPFSLLSCVSRLFFFGRCLPREPSLDGFECGSVFSRPIYFQRTPTTVVPPFDSNLYAFRVTYSTANNALAHFFLAPVLSYQRNPIGVHPLTTNHHTNELHTMPTATRTTLLPPPGLSASMTAPPTEEDDTDSTQAVLFPPDPTTTSPDQKQQPIRNLTRAFEALCTTEHSESLFLSPADAKSTTTTLISPTSVVIADNDVLSPMVRLEMHADLTRDLSAPLIQRVSYYSLIHDMNKEAAALCLLDPLVRDDCAMVDEEQWLLAAAAANDDASPPRPCPPTFLQAMGEVEYETTSTMRTQLWKPSRSWWEAKSGKNPWIEPASHNKRWRYVHEWVCATSP